MERAFAASHRTPTKTGPLPNLDETRERQLLIAARSGDPTTDSRAAITELWMSHGKLVAAIAAKYRRADIDHDDLINAGHLGLHTAITRFDTDRFDSRLSSYATVWIRWYIHDYIRRNAGPVRLPESKAHRQLAQSAPRLLAEARRSCEREGVEATDSELHMRIGRRIGLDAAEVARGLRLIQGARTALHADDAEGTRGLDLMDETAPTADDINERVDHQRLRIRIRTLANDILGEREKEVFLARTMSPTEDVPSLETFAARYEISTARVHQIETSARRKIAAALAGAGYEAANDGGVVTHLSQVRARRSAPVRPAAAMPRVAAGGAAYDYSGAAD